MFLDNPSVPSSRVKQSTENMFIMGLAVHEVSIPPGILTLKEVPIGCAKTLVEHYHSILPKIPEGADLIYIMVKA
jgi:hypothetical protein